ncbi:MAG: hypothetical protein IJF07_00800 [Lachnospiraceae bacterium]|nr:hypothetical protein [Lachnospiraceae bacterium]
MENDFHFNVSDSLRPISAWGYVGYNFLFSIPCIGLIVMLVFAFGGAKNVNVRNYARSFLLIYAICIVLLVIFMLVGGISVSQLADLATSYGY